jgi:hypothetical protein
MFICIHCNLDCKNKSNKTQHEKYFCDINPQKSTRKISKERAERKDKHIKRIPWNKGLTAESDVRVQKNTESVRHNFALNGLKINPETELERRRKLSASAKQQGFGGYVEAAGRSKKFTVNDSYGNPCVLQSTYELLCANILDDLRIKWIRPKHLKYNDKKRYYADFYLTDYNIYLDPKNDYKAKLDRSKIEAVSSQNDVTIHVILKQSLTKDKILQLVGECRNFS